MALRYLFVDMDSYFASVEQQARPELRNRPVGVVPTLADTTCCIAASYEAKRRGVTTGTKVRAARRLCPDICFVTARHRLYVRVHRRLVDTVEGCLHVDRVLSIDEMVCRLKGTQRQAEPAVQLANRVKTSIYERLGPYLCCSIGLGPNVMLAKVASELQKPDGLTQIDVDDLPERLYTLELTDLPGIGRRMKRRLRRHGICSVEQLCGLSAGRLSAIWRSKVLGRRWWHWLRGDDLPVPETRRRSVGHSRVLPPRQRGDKAARAVLSCLTHKAAARLRKMTYWTRSLTVHVRFQEGGSWRRRVRLPPCQDTFTLLRTVGRLWEQKPPGRLLKVGVVLGQLVPDGGVPLPLFEEGRHRLTLSKKVDQLNAKYGAHTVYFAGMWGAQAHADPRVAFTHVPEVEPLS